MRKRSSGHFGITVDTRIHSRATAILTICCVVIIGSPGSSAEGSGPSADEDPQHTAAPSGELSIAPTEVKTSPEDNEKVNEGSVADAGPPQPGNEDGGSIGSESEASKVQRSMNDVLGATARSDYVAKHFSFVFGGVVLNQFKIRVEPAPAPGWPDQFYLDSGNTAASAYLELGFRWRWAWLDRDSQLESRSHASEFQGQRIALENAIARRRAAQAILDAKLDVLAAEATTGGNDEALTSASTEATSAQQELDAARVAELVARIELTSSVTQGTQKRAIDDGTRDKFFGPCSLCKTKRGGFIIPDDWSVRLGFVFDGSTSANDVVATVGASDLYGELGLGWNLVRWSFATPSIAKEPIRATINFEANATFFTEENINDVHGRGIIGASFVLGLPVKYDRSARRDVFDPTRIENDSVIELLARFGAVVAEIPSFTGVYTNQLQSEFNQVSYSSQVGIGLDVEFNVPINERLGYLFARGQINALFDPNPWFISLGYTIPLSTITSAITSSASD